MSTPYILKTPRLMNAHKKLLKLGMLAVIKLAQIMDSVDMTVGTSPMLSRAVPERRNLKYMDIVARLNAATTRRKLKTKTTTRLLDALTRLRETSHAGRARRRISVTTSSAVITFQRAICEGKKKISSCLQGWDGNHGEWTERNRCCSLVREGSGLTSALHTAFSIATSDCSGWHPIELTRTAITPQTVVIAKLTANMYFSPYIRPLKMWRVKEMTDILARQRAAIRKIREMK